MKKVLIGIKKWLDKQYPMLLVLLLVSILIINYLNNQALEYSVEKSKKIISVLESKNLKYEDMINYLLPIVIEKHKFESVGKVVEFDSFIKKGTVINIENFNKPFKKCTEKYFSDNCEDKNKASYLFTSGSREDLPNSKQKNMQ